MVVIDTTARFPLGYLLIKLSSVFIVDCVEPSVKYLSYITLFVGNFLVNNEIT